MVKIAIIKNYEDEIKEQIIFHPFRKCYTKGEEYITWSCHSNMFNRFVVECDCIDESLIVSANAIKNELVLLSGDVIRDITFTIVLLTRTGENKNYTIKSQYFERNNKLKEN